MAAAGLMWWIAAAAMLLAGLPLADAWRYNQRTALAHAIAWATAAWLAWLTAAIGDWPAVHYLALCLTGCAGIAVLGARRPGVGAWNFVVAGLLVVLLRPLWETADRELGPVYLYFLGAVLAVPLLNYLPTRLGPAAVVLGCGCALQMPCPQWRIGILLVALAPWTAWLMVRRRRAASELDRLWLSYRDRLGYLWASRVRQQFNTAAVHAGWTARLAWNGMEGDSPAEALTTLRAVLKRFALD